jgi:hypothetical protein
MVNLLQSLFAQREPQEKCPLGLNFKVFERVEGPIRWLLLAGPDSTVASIRTSFAPQFSTFTMGTGWSRQARLMHSSRAFAFEQLGTHSHVTIPCKGGPLFRSVVGAQDLNDWYRVEIAVASDYTSSAEFSCVRTDLLFLGCLLFDSFTRSEMDIASGIL